MGKGSIRSVAILGGGPAGASLAASLGQAGLDVTVFHRGKRPPIIVGESLVPAIVPYLRRLGVEQEVASYSILKRGATFMLNREQDLNVFFDEVRGAKTPYSYNVPRDRFDATILAAAARHARIVETSARVEREGDSDRIRLDAATLSTAGLERQPDFIVDAGGRGRMVGRLMGVPTREGERKDTALHAHLEGVQVEVENNIHTDRLEHGWCWRVPLQGKVSIGIVIDSEYIKKFGDTPEEQLDNYLATDAHIRDWAKPARRVTPVVKYTNYQLASERGVGENWALLGDAFGFIDPVFSSGLLIAFQGAEELSKAILQPTDRAFEQYEASVHRSFDAWREVIQYFYDGSLLTLFQVGKVVQETRLGWLLDWHFRKHMPRIFTGEDATNRYSLGLIRWMVRYALAGNDPRVNQIV